MVQMGITTDTLKQSLLEGIHGVARMKSCVKSEQKFKSAENAFAHLPVFFVVESFSERCRNNPSMGSLSVCTSTVNLETRKPVYELFSLPNKFV